MSLVPTEPWYGSLLAAVATQQAGVTDYVGRPWAQHFERVALRVLFRNPSASRAQIEAALLHDAYMDRGGGAPMLEALGIGQDATQIIALTTPPPNADFYRVFEQIGPAECELYLGYVRRLVASGHRPAIEMKLADIQDTIDACRLGGTEILVDQFRNRYEPSRRILEAALDPRLVQAMDDDAALDQLAAMAGMPIPPEYREGVLRQWRLNQALAAPLLAFDLPDTVHPAPLYTA